MEVKVKGRKHAILLFIQREGGKTECYGADMRMEEVRTLLTSYRPLETAMWILHEGRWREWTVRTVRYAYEADETLVDAPKQRHAPPSQKVRTKKASTARVHEPGKEEFT